MEAKLVLGASKLHALAVAEQRRGHGIGVALLSTTRTISRACGIRLLYGNCEADVTEFYRHQGFRVCPPGVGMALGRAVLPGAVIGSQIDYLFGAAI